MPAKADIIVINARVFTSDESNPTAEAIAVKGNRIIYAGTNEGVKEFQNDFTQLSTQKALQ